MDSRIVLGFVQNLYMGLFSHSYKTSFLFITIATILYSIATYSTLILTGGDMDLATLAVIVTIVIYLTIIVRYGKIPVQSDPTVLIYSLMAWGLTWFIASKLLNYLYHYQTGTYYHDL